MPRFPIRKIAGLDWPDVPPGNVSQLWAMYLQLDRTQWLDPAEVEQGQLSQVRALLTHCGQNVPYYRELFAAAGVEPTAVRTVDDFRRVPLLQRRTYQEQHPRFQAQKLPAGTAITTTLRSSGTSGMPVEVRQTNLVNLWWFAFHLRDLDWCGVDVRGTLAVIRGVGASGPSRDKVLAGVRQPFWSEQLAQLMETGPAFLMDVHQEPARQLGWLLEVQPDYLLSYPPNLDHLASLLAESGRRLGNLRAILSVGETLTPECRARIESGFGVPIRDSYSCAEAGYLASPCPEGHGMHVHAENVLLEVLDEAGRPCAPGQAGRVVLTALHNFATPFVRYEVLDGATAGPGRCPCGRGLQALARVQGKQRPQFRLPDGRRKDCGFLVRHLRQLGGYHQHQIVQKAADHVIVRLVPGRTWTDACSQRVVELVRGYFEAPVRVEVQPVAHLEVSPAGKFRDVVNELDATDPPN